MIAFIVFYLAVGITIAISNRQIEEMAEIPEEEQISDLEFYLWIPLFWCVFLIWEVWFQKYNNEDE